jgi:L-cysteine S-thiosulfotransferase
VTSPVFQGSVFPGLVFPEFLFALLACGALAEAAEQPAARSGYEWLTPETRQIQDDEFANPGMLWVDEGRMLWNARTSTENSCGDCHHGAESMRGVATRYPAYSISLGRIINLEQRINQCRTERQHQSAFAYESRELLALTALVAFQSRGLPVQVVTDGSAASGYERGRAMFHTRRGQLNLSCANCHERHAGGRLHGETISQGQLNGYPLYRLLWQTLASSHRMFAWCNESVRAKTYAAGSQEYVDLELYVRSRGNDLPIETPAIRR